MTTMTTDTIRDGRSVTRGIGLPGKTAVAWSAAGGILTGGFLVAAMTIAGQLSGFGLLLTSTGLFAVGAVLGFLHGGVLGWLGRPAGMTPRETLGKLGLAAAYTIPALLVSWLLAGWIGMTMIAFYTGKPVALMGVGVSWLLGLGVVALAGEIGFKALRHAYAGWTNARAATLILVALLGGLLATFLAEQPQLWGMNLRLTPVGAVIAALAATLWLAGPIVTVSLGLLERMPQAPRATFGAPGTAAVNIGLALAVGIGLALLALPFHGAAPAAHPSGIASILTTALATEVLLRLFLITAIAWVLLRQLQVERARAAVVAVVLAALVQALVYLPGVLQVGFPSAAATAGFLAATAIVPALAFGWLFWKRGFGTAVLAHATALSALFMIAG